MSDLQTQHSHEPATPGQLPVADIEHTPRRADIDPKAAKRAERQVAFMFTLSMIFVVLFIVAYIGIDKYTSIYIPLFGEVGAMNIALGFTLGAAVFFIGAGAIQWAKKLMPDVEVVQERHSMETSPEESAEAVAQYARGKEESGFARFPLIRRSLIGAMALFPAMPLALLVPLLLVASVGAATMVISFAYAKESVPTHLQGTATGIANTGVMTGTLTQMPVIGLLLDARWQGAIANGVRQYGLEAFQLALQFLAAWTTLAVALLLLTRETHARPYANPKDA